jgi:hypothetical protein
MKILSIRQPWAYLITRGSKNIENRSWPTNYRGPVLIHASLKVDKQSCVDHGLDPTKLETGGVVGMAVRNDAEAVMLDLVQPLAARWQFIGFGGKARRDESGSQRTQRHGG